MADGLAEALLGLNFSPAQDPYGLAQQAVATSTPSLISPYASTGKAIGIGLGSVLLQSLLGYQARQSALQDTLQANTLANQMLQMQTPEERTALIGQEGVPSASGSRLSTLATALTAQEKTRAKHGLRTVSVVRITLIVCLGLRTVLLTIIAVVCALWTVVVTLFTTVTVVTRVSVVT